MILDSCGANCGWIAASIGCLGHGSFAVPMKGRAANSVDVDPLVFQTYKTTMCFITSWSVLLLGQEFTYTPWGILSGLLWVHGGTAGIFGVRNAGLAVSVGTWSGVSVVVSFIWGMLIFDEQRTAKTREQALVGMSLMILGLAGMSFFSSPSFQKNALSATSDYHNKPCGDECDLQERLLQGCDSESGEAGEDVELQSCPSVINGTTLNKSGVGNTHSANGSALTPLPGDHSLSESVSVCGMKMKRRVLGIAGAATNGLLSGSMLVPMHYAPMRGLAYVISFAIGATIALSYVWTVRLCYQIAKTGSARSAWEALPSFHLRVMLIPGVLSGLIWSIGNVGSILSVTYLGEGVGMSVVQACMIVSGLFGIFWFQEIEGVVPIMGWLLSAFIAVSSIFFLSHEHTAGQR